ncbi:MAG TPA: hypothetical protein VMG34_04630, partial [Bacteroidota bacterium]|nr:hypothetical protein [Bacteroidota bacterium]
EELMIGFAHGMHWSAYVAQTIALLGILFLAGLLGSIFWRIVERSKGGAAAFGSAGVLGLLTAVVGIAFVWFLWYWNLVGYRF